MPLHTTHELLYCTLALGQELDARRAAAKAGIPETSLRRQIDQLEARLGDRIFEWSGPQVRLTGGGQRLVRRIERLFALEAD